jgi:hypothetical protein
VLARWRSREARDEPGTDTAGPRSRRLGGPWVVGRSHAQRRGGTLFMR